MYTSFNTRKNKSIIKWRLRVMVNQSKKTNKKSKWIIGIVVMGVILLTVPFIFGKKKEDAFTQEAPKIRDITTYYSFSGAVESKSRQEVFAPGNTQISELYVEEGEQVEKEDVLVRFINGNEVVAQISGSIAQVDAKENESVMAGSKVLEVVDYKDLQVTIKIDEYEYPNLELGEKVQVHIGAVDKEVSGTLTKLSDEAINQNGVSYFTGVVDLGKEQNIKVGMNAEVKKIHQEQKGVLTLSMGAVQFDELNAPYVFVQTDEKTPMKQSIQTGINDGIYVEVLEGVDEGDIIMIPKPDPVYPEAFQPPFARE